LIDPADVKAADGAEGRLALVTGTSSGIGAAVAQRLLRDGWAVVGVDRAAPSIQHAGFRAHTVDLLDRQATDAWLGALAPVSAMVHAAGFMRTAPLGALDLRDGEAMWRLHVETAARLANALAPRFPDGGRIVLIGSRTAAGAAERSQYAATKAALIAMTRSWALELAPRGITANVISPAATETAMLSDPARAGVAPRRPPIGRFIRPEEVAGVAAFLLSAEAAAITGQNIVICGGSSL
jgi:NAD(P)-dependent dehydrogenase (short-subunit alcohol dehydrogenase family)